MTDEEIIRNFTELSAKCENNTEAINRLEKRQDEYGQLLTTMQVFKNEQDHMKTDISEIKDTVKTIADKPIRRWDALVTSGLSALLGAFIAWAMSGFPGT